jgi:hypothetical protein
MQEIAYHCGVDRRELAAIELLVRLNGEIGKPFDGSEERHRRTCRGLASLGRAGDDPVQVSQ